MWVTGVGGDLRPLAQRLTGDASIALVLLAFAMAIATAYLSAHAQRSSYLLKYYGPAVMLATGHGFERPITSAAPKLAEFLNNQRAALAPEDVPEGIATVAVSPFERVHRYAMILIGWWWRMFGISWSALDGLLALFFGITCACAYGIFRLGMARPLAAAITVAFIFSPAMLHILPQFRDFSKAPFILLTLLLVGIPVRYRLPWPVLILDGLAIGLTLGLGLGFRGDFLAVLPFACVSVLFFAAGDWRRTLVPRVACVLVLLVAFAVAGGPILRAAEGGSSSTHYIVLGLSDPFNKVMGLFAPYEVGHFFQDAYAHTRTNAHDLWHSSRPAADGLWTENYEAAGRDYISVIASTFPADFVRRALRAVEIILRDVPYVANDVPKIYNRPEFITWMEQARMDYFGWFRHGGVVLAIAAYLLIAAVNLRWALALAFLTAMLTGYTSLQFHIRHFFPYEIFFFFVLGAAIQLVAAAATLLWRKDRRAALLGAPPQRRPWRWPAVHRVAIAGGLAAAAMIVVLGGAHLWQHRQVGALYAAYAAAPRSPLATEVVESERGALLHLPDFLPPGEATPREKAFRVQPGVLAVSVQTGPRPFSLEFVYRANVPHADFSQTVTVPATATPEEWCIYMPVFQTTDSYFGGTERRFAGIRSKGATPNAVQGFYELDDPGALPLLVTLTLPKDYSGFPRAAIVRDGDAAYGA